MKANETEKFEYRLAGDDITYQKLMNAYLRSSDEDYKAAVLRLKRVKINLYEEEAFKDEVLQRKKFRSTSIYDIKVTKRAPKIISL